MTDQTENKKAKKPVSKSGPKTREERLAAALRENLKRRKAQMRLKKTDALED